MGSKTDADIYHKYFCFWALILVSALSLPFYQICALCVSEFSMNLNSMNNLYLAYVCTYAFFQIVMILQKNIYIDLNRI